MIVCLDSGNTRVKWGVYDGTAWLAQGAVAQADIAQLAGLPAEWPRPDKVMLANVAGPQAASRLAEQLAPWLPCLQEVRPSARAGGVSNCYRSPERLGVDRWCALVGARALHAGAALVVMAGTATTIDTLAADGCFAGGDILPGIGLMRRSLAQGTAALPLAAGGYDPLPRCTEDAIVSGILEAQAGAVERVFARLAGPDRICLISGGHAGEIAEHLSIPFRLVPNLPLEGLRQLAAGA
ncbi:MAG: type III pantothenate kinase [Azonexus sp.]